MTRKRGLSAVALGASMALLAACGGGEGDGGAADPGTGGDAGGGGGDATITWWHNGNNDPLRGYWEDVAAEFEEANPGTNIEISALQNEDLRTRLTAALQSNDPPDLFQQWGGGEMANQVEAGLLMPLGDKIPEAIERVGPSAAGWQLGDETYGLPWSLGVVGFWYNKALFEQAGITAPPATFDEWFEAVEQLKAAGITPVAVGAADEWPAAHYYYYAVVRECSQETLERATVEHDFSDPCFMEAGELVQRIVEADPFNEGFLGTSAQQGATSSAGLLANGQAAMELMGHWNPGVMQGLTEDQQGLGEDLGWFPFPSVTNGEGDPGAALGGGDGFSCSAQAPEVCADFLGYVVEEDVQTRFAETGAGIPTVPGALEGLEDPNLIELAEYRDAAPYVQLYLDTAFGPNIGGALNEAVVQVFAGQAEPEDIVAAMQRAAETE